MNIVITLIVKNKWFAEALPRPPKRTKMENFATTVNG